MLYFTFGLLIVVASVSLVGWFTCLHQKRLHKTPNVEDEPDSSQPLSRKFGRMFSDETTWTNYQTDRMYDSYDLNNTRRYVV